LNGYLYFYELVIYRQNLVKIYEQINFFSKTKLFLLSMLDQRQ
jgi:hypothetical protein